MPITKNNVITVKTALKSQLKQAAEIIRGQMETNAKLHITEGVYDQPETWYRRTGALRNSITTKVAEDGNDVLVAVGSNMKYAPYVELGTGILAEKGDGRKTGWTYKGSDGKFHHTTGMAPRPFLRPAVEKHTEQYKSTVEKCLKGDG